MYIQVLILRIKGSQFLRDFLQSKTHHNHFGFLLTAINELLMSIVFMN